MEYIFTCNKDYFKLAIYELKKFDLTFNLIDWLENGVGFGTSQLNPYDLSNLIINTPIIFVRHIFEVNAILEYDIVEEKIVDLCRERLDISQTFSIQTRFAHGSKKKLNLTDWLSKVLIQDGFKMDITASKQIVSIFGTEEHFYIGINNAKYNLSHWKGGMPHYASTKEFEFVSRAEYKLKEALDNFNIDITKIKKGADLGAAPGGWTKVLADNGIEVSSIDPSYLNKEIERKPQVKYYHMRVEEYLELPIEDRFDIVVNDMKMDVSKSIKIINSFYNRIVNQGIVIMTFKLPHEFSYKGIQQYLNEFIGFEVIGCRQLFHNRSEITVALKKKEKINNNDAIINDDDSKEKTINRPKKKKKLSKKLMRKQTKSKK